ncbi:MAG: energy transducer TonB, partial [Bacteroidetes bacterium]
MNLSKNDWIGLGASVGLHLVLLVLFTFMNLGVSDPQPIGYIQVEFGDFAEGQPVRRTPDPRPEVQEVVPDPEPEPVEQPEPQTAPPEEARPVDLPDQPEVVDEEKITSPETETISPEEQNDPAPVVGPEPKPERPPVQPLGGGDPEGRAGAEQGDDGEGQD